MTTDEIAKAMLTYERQTLRPDGTLSEDLARMLATVAYDHLQALAKLWLMREELQTFIDTTIAHSKTVVSTAHRAMRPDLIDDYFGQPDFKRLAVEK